MKILEMKKCKTLTFTLSALLGMGVCAGIQNQKVSVAGANSTPSYTINAEDLSYRLGTITDATYALSDDKSYISFKSTDANPSIGFDSWVWRMASLSQQLVFTYKVPTTKGTNDNRTSYTSTIYSMSKTSGNNPTNPQTLYVGDEWNTVTFTMPVNNDFDSVRYDFYNDVDTRFNLGEFIIKDLTFIGVDTSTMTEIRGLKAEPHTHNGNVWIRFAGNANTQVAINELTYNPEKMFVYKNGVRSLYQLAVSGGVFLRNLAGGMTSGEVATYMIPKGTIIDGKYIMKTSYEFTIENRPCEPYMADSAEHTEKLTSINYYDGLGVINNTLLSDYNLVSDYQTFGVSDLGLNDPVNGAKEVNIRNLNGGDNKSYYVTLPTEGNSTRSYVLDFDLKLINGPVDGNQSCIKLKVSDTDPGQWVLPLWHFGGRFHDPKCSGTVVDYSNYGLDNTNGDWAHLKIGAIALQGGRDYLLFVGIDEHIVSAKVVENFANKDSNKLMFWVSDHTDFFVKDHDYTEVYKAGEQLAYTGETLAYLGTPTKNVIADPTGNWPSENVIHIGTSVQTNLPISFDVIDTNYYRVCEVELAFGAWANENGIEGTFPSDDALVVRNGNEEVTRVPVELEGLAGTNGAFKVAFPTAVFADSEGHMSEFNLYRETYKGQLFIHSVTFYHTYLLDQYGTPAEEPNGLITKINSDKIKNLDQTTEGTTGTPVYFETEKGDALYFSKDAVSEGVASEFRFSGTFATVTKVSFDYRYVDSSSSKDTGIDPAAHSFIQIHNDSYNVCGQDKLLADGQWHTLTVEGNWTTTRDIIVKIQEFNGEIVITNLSIAHIHEGEFTPASAPSCTEDGNIDYYTCEFCGVYFDSTQTVLEAGDLVVPATGHDWEAAGYEGEYHHDADGHWYECHCGEESTHEDHVFEGDYEHDENEHWQVCVCGCEGPHSAHDWDSGVEAVPATCGADGEMIYTCTTCGATKTEAIPATGLHTYGDPVVVTAPTETEDGEIKYVCTECQHEEFETVDSIQKTVDEATVNMSMAFTYVETIKHGVSYYSDVDFRLLVGVNTKLQRLTKYVENCRLEMTVTCSNGKSMVVDTWIESSLADISYAVIDLGDCLSSYSLRKRLSYTFDISAVLYVDDTEYAIEDTMSHSIASLCETYYANEETRPLMVDLYETLLKYHVINN